MTLGQIPDQSRRLLPQRYLELLRCEREHAQVWEEGPTYPETLFSAGGPSLMRRSRCVMQLFTHIFPFRLPEKFHHLHALIIRSYLHIILQFVHVSTFLSLRQGTSDLLAELGDTVLRDNGGYHRALTAQQSEERIVT